MPQNSLEECAVAIESKTCSLMSAKKLDLAILPPPSTYFFWAGWWCMCYEMEINNNSCLNQLSYGIDLGTFERQALMKKYLLPMAQS